MSPIDRRWSFRFTTLPMGLLFGSTAVPLLFLLTHVSDDAIAMAWSSLAITMIFTIAGAAVATTVGGAIGMLLGTRECQGRRWLLALSVLPIAAPPAFWWIGATRLTTVWGNPTGPVAAAAVAGLALSPVTLFSSATGTNVPPHARRIGFVFQDLALWPHLSAIDHVFLVGRPAGLTRAKAHDLLESVGLGGLDQRRPGQLSGGEQQRLAIARALAGTPSILLLDEPFSSVDRTTKDSLYDLIRSLSPRIPGPTIYVTHHVDDAVSLSEAVVTLKAGTLAPGEHPWDDD